MMRTGRTSFDRTALFFEFMEVQKGTQTRLRIARSIKCPAQSRSKNETL
jgi:hypothetical protein